MNNSVFDLKDKTILITGASSGIGRAIACTCSRAGGRLILLSRNKETLEETCSLCDGDNHVIWPSDLSDLNSIPSLVRSIAKEVGPLSGIVHSAGIHRPAPIRAVRAEAIVSMISLNSIAGVMLIKGLSMRGCVKPPASVVFLSSILGRLGQPGTVAYSMSKGAIEQACKSLALELAAEQIRVNCVAPSVIRTPMTETFFSSLGEDMKNEILKRHPLGIGDPDDVANAVLFLLSDAGKYITGSSLLVDGGYSAQ